MPTLNRWQVIYYVDKRIWRKALELAERRADAPAIVYYWWLGGDLQRARQARYELVSTTQDTTAAPTTTH